MANRWAGVTVDCIDVERVSRFWSALLDRPKGPSMPGWVYLGELGDPQPRLVFQPVPEAKQGKVRLHLDVVVDDAEQGTAQVIALGGRFTGERHEYDEGVVLVMADPEENEFCITQFY
ncbi:VOC family protein [Streptomyces sp. NPDC005494]|uniref:VOC family protein n=1 Tax=Streptomyces sp. NPDC005494 TaxID=3364715 RepID=UPI0036C97C36